MTAFPMNIEPGDMFLLDGEPFEVEVVAHPWVQLRAYDGRTLVVPMGLFLEVFERERAVA